jgi:Ca-activated chloride channel family protein
MKSASLWMLFALLLVAIAMWRPWRMDQWLTADQQAERAFRTGRFDEAARLWSEPLRQGTAFYRDRDFKSAERAFARDRSADGAYDHGTALVMLGKYDEAIRSYDRALQLRPGWKEAQDNRAIAQARKDRLAASGGVDEGTEGELKADSIEFDGKTKHDQGETVEVAGGTPLNDEELRSLWLRRVQTKPADFLRARFAYQLQEQEAKP